MDTDTHTNPRVIASICGGCSEMRAASHAPDFCACGARFDRGDGYAVIVVALVIGNSGVGARKRVVFNGRWQPEDRQALIAEAAAVGWETEEASP